jgi:transcriptional regulator with PAS, ATPase and Fis domain
LQPDDPEILPLVGSSRTMRELARQIESLAAGAQATVLLIGETGTGKGRLAQYVHARSARASQAFVGMNCTAPDATAVGTELFGGGLLPAICGGTMFIDEVADLAPDLQLRLLEVIGGQAGPFAAPPPVRVVAAATKDLVNEVNSGRFREDLYYRLSATPVHLPPLRARSRDDLSELIIATFNALSLHMSNTPETLGADVVDCLIAYPWPGNIRELRNVLERAIIAARGDTMVQRMHLPVEMQELQGPDAVHTPRTLTEIERAHIHRTLRAHQSNRTHAARELGISRATLIKKIKEYGLIQPGTAGA